MKDIKYEPEVRERAGNVTIDDSKLNDLHKKSLLQTLYRLAYTNEGREKHMRWEKDQPRPSDAQIRQALRRAFTEEYELKDHELVDALIEGHLAADKYVRLLHPTVQNGKPDVDRLSPKQQKELEQHEANYKKNIEFVMGRLTEDALTRDFSMLW